MLFVGRTRRITQYTASGMRDGLSGVKPFANSLLCRLPSTKTLLDRFRLVTRNPLQKRSKSNNLDFFFFGRLGASNPAHNLKVMGSRSVCSCVEISRLRLLDSNFSHSRDFALKKRLLIVFSLLTCRVAWFAIRRSDTTNYAIYRKRYA